MNIDFSKASEILRNCKDAVILTHQTPDGDCIGSGFALKDILAELGIRSRVVCSDEFPKRYDFITSIGAGEEFEPQTVLAVDIADKKLMGKYEAIYGDKVKLCIDHHETNKGYAEYTLVNENAAAACEVIYDLAKFMGLKLSEHCITSLYTGIVTDSGCFKFDCTGARTHEIAGEMMRDYPEINFYKINRSMCESKSREKIKLESKISDLLEEYCDGRLGFIAITQDIMKEMGVSIEELEGFANKTIELETAEIGILIREKKDGTFKCSMRSASEINVSKICETIGGGGHAKAAGCTLSDCTIDEAKQILLDAARKALEV